MRGSLRGVRSRVERLANQVVRDGCSVCREDEARTRLSWVDWRTGTRDDELQLKKTCTGCGRTYELQYTLLTWIRDNPTS